ncbi:MAG TPA: ABC transporter permease [Stellaceae bacterium]|nr:ABC transporter permease [Stellaceae bacterium]
MSSTRSPILRIVFLVAAFGIWEVAVWVLSIPTYVVPAPSGIFLALYRGFASLIYVHHLWVTIYETVLGFIAGTTVAFLLGTVVALSRRTEYYLYPFIIMFQSLPKVALAPLIVVWFGLGLSSKVVNAALIAFFPLMVNTIVGLRSADEDRVNLMRSLDAREWQIFWMLRLPGALPFIMAGLEVAMIFALIGAIVAEFVGAQAGLGMLVQTLNFNGDVAGAFSILLILSFLGLLLNQIITLVRRRVLFWDASEKVGAREPSRGGMI